eukprot:848975-Rhodomonas_salina.1
MDPDVQARLVSDTKSKEDVAPVLNPNLDPKAKPDPLNKIPHAEDVPGLLELLEEYQDVFPEDLPAALPVERQFEMKIPITVKQGSTPPSQA